MSEVTVFGCNKLLQRLLNVSRVWFWALLGRLHHMQVHFTQKEKFNIRPLTEENLGQGEGKSSR